MKFSKFFFIAVAACIAFLSCNNASQNKTSDDQDSVVLTKHEFPKRLEKSVIYEVNVRQYTPEGTFSALEKEIPRLKKLGADILWLMPINPIGKKNRKGSLGSYYSVQNYVEINPEFGTKDDFKKLVQTIHQNEMLVIIDWVANHTAWDHPWITEHPDWYTKDSITKEIVAPVKDWTDVADLNYENPGLRKQMTEDMKYWLKNFDIDGFRCDVAMMVPTTFWDSARAELDKIKPVFMLSEAEQPDLMKKAFDMNYGWNLHHKMNQISQGKEKPAVLNEYFEKDKKEYEKSDIRMYFTSNHDENTWNGTEFKRLGDARKAWTVFSFVAPGMPLIYTGQEFCMDKQLRFFDKDTVLQKTCEMTDLYEKLAQIKSAHQALWNGEAGGDLTILKTDKADVFAFFRVKNDSKILAIFNFSKKDTKVQFTDFTFDVKDLLSGKDEKVGKGAPIALKAWDYKLCQIK